MTQHEEDIDLNSLIALEPTDITTPSDKPAEPTEFAKDLEKARETQLDALKQAQESMGELASVAYQSQNYLAYEKLSMLLKTISEMNKDFVDISRQKRDESETEIKAEDSKHVNNNLFVGSTAELMQLMVEMDKQKEKE